MKNLVRVISQNGGIFICVVDSTEIVAESERIHNSSAPATAALGRLLTGAALMGAMLKNDEDSLMLKVNGGGEIGTVTAISDNKGNVRGCCDNPYADKGINSATQKLDVGGIVGTDGTLTVVRGMGLKESYTGCVPLVSGEIAEDITSYYATSEQIPTACSLGVLVNPDLTVKAAGGFMLQLLPGASDDEISLIEKNLSRLDSISTMIDRGMKPADIAFSVLEGFSPELLDEECVEYRCNCSDEKMLRVMVSLGKDELFRLADEQQTTELVCSYCNKKYCFSDDELRQLIP